MTVVTPGRELLALADWLAQQQDNFVNSPIVNDPVIAKWVAQLKSWESLTRLAAKPSDEGVRKALNRSFADAVCTIEGVANALRHNPKIDPDQVRHDLLLNVQLYREVADANGIHIRTIKSDEQPYDFSIERDGHAALDRVLSRTGNSKR